jgi:hypothetical protein
MRMPYVLLRTVHIAASPLIGAFVYSGFLRANETFVRIVQWGVFPLVAGEGLAMWLAPRVIRRANLAEIAMRPIAAATSIDDAAAANKGSVKR